ncbi:hypothetical protein B566_EDAN005624 [Ephemera danica]|nr:hypothetical protein B566_EDAN005624 [Ephemera danica]
MPWLILSPCSHRDRIMMWRFLLLFVLLPSIQLAASDDDSTNSTTREGRDSYLDAYKASQGFGDATKPQPFKSSPVFVKPVKVYPQSSSQVYVTPEPPKYGVPDAPPPDAKYPENHKYSPPDNSYLPAATYGTPNTNYGAPPAAPKPEKYGSPPEKYGPPPDKYGPPVKYENNKEIPWYGVPHFHHHYTMQPEQITDPEPVDQGHGGFDVKTVFKFLAKILVLKAIVKFVYIVMYLLFMPKINLLEMLALGDTEKEKPDSAETVEKPDVDAGEDDLQMEEDDDDDSFFRTGKSSVPKSKLDYLTEKIVKALTTPPS